MAEASRSNPANGTLWEQEHGPKGGDEINIIEKGKNYGWPKSATASITTARRSAPARRGCRA